MKRDTTLLFIIIYIVLFFGVAMAFGVHLGEVDRNIYFSLPTFVVLPWIVWILKGKTWAYVLIGLLYAVLLYVIS